MKIVNRYHPAIINYIRHRYGKLEMTRSERKNLFSKSRDFRVRIQYVQHSSIEASFNPGAYKTEFIFDNDEEYMMFMLRWS